MKDFLKKYGLFTGVGVNTVGIILVILFAVSFDCGIWPILSGVFLCVAGTALIVVGGAQWHEELRLRKKEIVKQELKKKKE